MSYSVKGECRNSGRTHFPKGTTPWNKGKKGVYSLETRLAMGAHGIGKPSPRKGVMLTNKTKDKIRNSLIKRCENLIGENSGYPEPKTWLDITEKVFKRDNYRCQECGAELARVKGPGVIQCHHIDYNTANLNLSNLITLCASCHCKTTFNREDWLDHFRSKL